MDLNVEISRCFFKKLDYVLTRCFKNAMLSVKAFKKNVMQHFKNICLIVCGCKSGVLQQMISFSQRILLCKLSYGQRTTGCQLEATPLKISILTLKYQNIFKSH